MVDIRVLQSFFRSQRLKALFLEAQRKAKTKERWSSQIILHFGEFLDHQVRILCISTVSESGECEQVGYEGSRCHHGNASQSFCWKSGGAGLKDRLHPHSLALLLFHSPQPPAPKSGNSQEKFYQIIAQVSYFIVDPKQFLDQVLAVSVRGLLPGSGPRYSKAQGIM